MELMIISWLKFREIFERKGIDSNHEGPKIS